MKFKLSKKVIALAATACVMVGILGVGSALAYFTTYTDASGTATVNLGTPPTNTVEDKVVDWEKYIHVTNTGTIDGMVRVQAFAGHEYDVSKGVGEGWEYRKDEDSGDYYYFYDDILGPGEDTTPLVLPVAVGHEKPEEETFNVVVIEECAPVIYVDGEPQGDWDRVVMNSDEYK